jgi:Arc/MetJ-type ribon-helix-helix transcriptional regulator
VNVNLAFVSSIRPQGCAGTRGSGSNCSGTAAAKPRGFGRHLDVAGADEPLNVPARCAEAAPHPKLRASSMTASMGRSLGMLESYPVGGGLVVVRKVAVTLPEELFEMVERLREVEHRSRSEVFQEALRRYFGAPVYEPSDEERRRLDEALADLDRDPEGGRPWAVVRDELLAE